MASAEKREVAEGQLPLPAEATAPAPRAKTGGGVFDGTLAAYRTTTDEDYRRLFTTGLIVPDTNTLLNLYRYHPATRIDLLSILTRMSDQIWIPRHVMYEFFQGRASAIESRSKELDKAIESLRKNTEAMGGAIREWTNRAGLPQLAANTLVDDIRRPVDGVIRKLRQLGGNRVFKEASDTSKDPILVALDSILSENVGAALAENELQRVKAIAIERFANKTPPGWRDAEKRRNPEGDYIIWYETLKEAKRLKRDVLFITGDVKPDWWHMHAGEAKGPLPELVQEMNTQAGVQLFMLRPASLLIHASRVLELNVSRESVQDAERVSIESACHLPTPGVTQDGSKASAYKLKIYSFLGFEADMSARHWRERGGEPRFEVVKKCEHTRDGIAGRCHIDC